MKKRILAVVLCVAMLLSVVPFTLTAGAALATDDTAKTFFTVHTPADPNVKDNNDYIVYNNACGDKAWGITRWTNTTDPWATKGSYPVVIDGEALFPFEIPADYSHQLFKHEEGVTNKLNSSYSSQFIVKRAMTFIPTTYEMDIGYDKGEKAIVDLHADAADYNYIVMRFKVTGGVADTTSALGMEVGGNTNGGATLKDVTLYDVKTGEVTKYTSGKIMQIPYNFDGYIIVNKTSMTGALANVKRISFSPYMFGYENNWDGKTMLFGNMMIVKDISAFLQVHGAPAFSLDSTDKSVTVSTDDAAAVFSTDKDAADASWLAKDQFNATLADIGADREVTVYAKYVGSEKVSHQKIWTDPYSTHKGDGAYYLMNVYDDAQFYSHTSYAASQTPAEIAGSGWPSATVCKNVRGEHSGDSSFSRLNIKDLDGETYIELDVNPTNTGCANNTLKAPAFTYKGTQGVHSSVDTTNLNYVAIRLRIVEDTPVNAQRSFYIYAGGYKNATQAEASTYQSSSWADAYLIDKTTGAVSPAQSYKGNLIFTGDFNGWVVFPVTAYPDGKYLLTKGLTSFQPFIHGTGCHDKLGAGWLDATLYFGDVVLFGDEDLFKSVHVCGAAGHVEETAATCNKKATCSVCGQSYGEVDPDAHGTNTELRGVVIADCQQPGYTGDTWCKDCETKIADGTPILQGTCADKDGKWETDGTYHWHTCTCGAILDKATHSGGTATCTDLAVCEICQIGYGELDEDNHCDKDAEYEFDANEHFYTCECGETFGNAKHEGGTATCKDQAICKVCKQPYGEKNADNHVGETEVKDIVAAECGKEGFTGNTYCKDCGVKIKDGEKIEATGNHTAAEELKDAAEATTTKPGYTGDKVCKDCGFVMEKGEVIPTLTDDTNNNEGQTPGGSDNEQTPGGSDDEQTPGDGDNAGAGEDGDGDNAGAGDGNEGSASPETGDNASILVAVLMALMAGAVLALSKKRAQSK